MHEIPKGKIQLAFCFNHLYSNQQAYTCIYNANEHLIKFGTVDFSIFFHNQMPPSISPFFARYYIEEVSNYKGNIVASSVEDVIRLHNTDMARKFFYLQDIYESRKLTKIHQELLDALSNKNIVKFARSTEIRDHYRKFGFDIHENVVEDYNIEQILEIINASSEKK